MTEDTIDPAIGLKTNTSNSREMEKVEQAYKQFRSSNEENSHEFGELGGDSIDDFSWF
ncbi:MAG: hypothetical protein HKN05_15800 [Rhizobiales bacterium]|nr:hypothetical protein [Hyphomicrobiales bacterium]